LFYFSGDPMWTVGSVLIFRFHFLRGDSAMGDDGGPPNHHFPPKFVLFLRTLKIQAKDTMGLKRKSLALWRLPLATSKTITALTTIAIAYLVFRRFNEGRRGEVFLGNIIHWGYYLNPRPCQKS
jgi:hypothetical protein